MKRKVQFNFYPFYDVSGMSRHLEHMARKGWFLEKISGARWYYRWDTPKPLHYGVSYYAKASIYDPEVTDGQKTFQEFCLHSGWKLAAESAKLQVFYNQEPNPVPIYTDPQSELDSVEAVAKSQTGVSWLLLVLLMVELLLLSADFRRDPMRILSNASRLGLICSFLLLIVNQVTELTLYHIWRHRARLAVIGNSGLTCCCCNCQS